MTRGKKQNYGVRVAIWLEELSEWLHVTHIFTHWLLMCPLAFFIFPKCNSWVSEFETQLNLCSYKLTTLLIILLWERRKLVKPTFLTLLKPPSWQELKVLFPPPLF